MVDDLGPGESTAQPPCRGHDGRLACRVIHRLALVVFAVQLDEEAEFGPSKIDTRNEQTVGVLDAKLPSRGIETSYVPSELDHERLEQTLGGRCPWRPSREHSNDAGRSRGPCAAERG